MVGIGKKCTSTELEVWEYVTVVNLYSHLA
jgi:hypothetical protein